MESEAIKPLLPSETHTTKSTPVEAPVIPLARAIAAIDKTSLKAPLESSLSVQSDSISVLEGSHSLTPPPPPRSSLAAASGSAPVFGSHVETPTRKTTQQGWGSWFLSKIPFVTKTITGSSPKALSSTLPTIQEPPASTQETPHLPAVETPTQDVENDEDNDIFVNANEGTEDIFVDAKEGPETMGSPSPMDVPEEGSETSHHPVVETIEQGGFFRRLGQKALATLSHTASLISHATGGLPSSREIVQKTKEVCTDRLRSAIPSLVPPLVNGAITEFQKVNPVSLEGPTRLIEETVDGRKVISSLSTFSRDIAKIVGDSFAEKPPLEEGQQESILSLTQRTALTTACRHPYIMQAIEKNVLNAFSHIQKTISAISPIEMNALLCNILESVTQQELSFEDQEEGPQQEHGDVLKKLSTRLTHTLLSLCLPQGAQSLDLGSFMNELPPFSLLGSEVDITSNLRALLYTQLEGNLQQVSQSIISQLLSPESREKMVLMTMESLHSAVGSSLARSELIPSQTSTGSSIPSLMDGAFREITAIPEGERVSEAGKTEAEKALTKSLTSFVQFLSAHLFSPSTHRLLSKGNLPVTVAQKMAPTFFSYIQSLDIKKILANAVQQLPSYLSMSQAPPEDAAKMESERKERKERLDLLTGNDGMRELARGVGKTISQSLEVYINTTPGIGFRLLHYLNTSFGNAITKFIGFFTKFLLRKSWKDSHLQTIDNILKKTFSTEAAPAILITTLETKKAQSIAPTPSS